MFDPADYLTLYPDVRSSGIDPLDHFILYGWRDGRDPNPLFSVRWYLSNNPDVAKAGINPLLHYILKGEREGRPASPNFSARYYSDRYPDLETEHGTLLAHYLAQGRGEGRRGAPSLAPEVEGAVTDVGMAVVKPISAPQGRCIALLVCQAVDGNLRPHVRPYVERLARAGYAVGLIACTDAGFEIEPDFVDLLAALYVRADKGSDFAAWAHVLRVEPSIFAAERLLLANDSVLTGGGVDTLSLVLKRMQAAAADLVGLTDAYEVEWHIQSDFMLVGSRALASVAFQRFVFSVQSLRTSDPQTDPYEVRFASALRAAGLTCMVLHPSTDRLNPTCHHWKSLLATGFPLIKLAVLQNQQGETGAVEDADLTRAGFDLKLVNELRAPVRDRIRPKSAGSDLLTCGNPETPAKPPRLPGQPLKVDFIGTWDGPGSDASFGRRLVEAWWRTRHRVNLRPLPGGRERDVMDFEGAADIAVVQITRTMPTTLGPHLEATLARSAMTIAIRVDGTTPVWPNSRSLRSVESSGNACKDIASIISIAGLEGDGAQVDTRFPRQASKASYQ